MSAEVIDAALIRELLRELADLPSGEADRVCVRQVIDRIRGLAFADRDPVLYSVATYAAIRYGDVSPVLLRDSLQTALSRLAADDVVTGLILLDEAALLINRYVSGEVGGDSTAVHLTLSVIGALSRDDLSLDEDSLEASVTRFLAHAGEAFGALASALVLRLASLDAPPHPLARWMRVLWRALRIQWDAEFRVAFGVKLLPRLAERDSELRFDTLRSCFLDLQSDNFPADTRTLLVEIIAANLTSIPEYQALTLGRSLADYCQLVSTGQPVLDAQVHLCAARAAYRCSKLDVSRDYVERAIRYFPDAENAPATLRAQIYNFAGAISYRLGDANEAKSLLGQALGHATDPAQQAQILANLRMLQDQDQDLHPSHGDQAETTRSTLTKLIAKSRECLRAGDYSGAEASALDVLQVSEAADNPTYDLEYSHALTVLGDVSLATGRLNDAVSYDLRLVNLLTRRLTSLPDGTDHSDRVRLYETIDDVNNRAIDRTADRLMVASPQVDELWQGLIRFREIERIWFSVVREMWRQTVSGSGQETLSNAYKNCCADVAALELDGPDASGEDLENAIKHFNHLSELFRQRTELEIALSSHPRLAADIRNRLMTTADDIRQRLRPADLLLEFACYRDRHTADGDSYKVTVFIVRRAQPALLTSLCHCAASLDELGRVVFADLALLRERLVTLMSGELNLSGVARLFVIPDGPLRELSFDNLITGDGACVADGVAVEYLGSAHDLMWSPANVTEPTAPVVIGAPAFATAEDSAVAGDNVRDQLGSMPYQPWPPLPGSEVECRWIAHLLGVQPSTGETATSSALTTVTRPRILHVASHGFLFGHQEWRSPDDSEYVLLPPASSRYGRLPALRVTDPLLATGIVTAGIEAWLSGRPASAVFGRGMVTAQDFLRLDLGGTRLVVLSGCRTGTGVPDRYRGSVDLRSALALTGAHAAILALWDVPDIATAILMRLFYASVAEGREISSDTFRVAKIQLRDLRASQLRSLLNEWHPKISIQSRYLSEILSMPDDARPFRAPAAWAGFAWYTLVSADADRETRPETE